MTRVRNINGTSDNKCKCGSWLEHWKKFSREKQLPSYCSEKSCDQKPEDGAHVQKESLSDCDWYIVPLCVEHNRKDKSLEIKDTVEFVSANVDQTCGRVRG